MHVLTGTGLVNVKKFENCFRSRAQSRMAEKYEILGKIGDGAYSDVYKCKDRVKFFLQHFYSFFFNSNESLLFLDKCELNLSVLSLPYGNYFFQLHSFWWKEGRPFPLSPWGQKFQTSTAVNDRSRLWAVKMSPQTRNSFLQV